MSDYDDEDPYGLFRHYEGMVERILRANKRKEPPSPPPPEDHWDSHEEWFQREETALEELKRKEYDETKREGRNYLDQQRIAEQRKGWQR